METQILSDKELPSWFKYPPAFLRVLDQRLLNLDPWIILTGHDLNDLYLGLKKRFPSRDIIPFAVRQDNDDIACWEKDDLIKVQIVHDYASPGWENREAYDSFWDWFRFAVEETIYYEDD